MDDVPFECNSINNLKLKITSHTKNIQSLFKWLQNAKKLNKKIKYYVLCNYTKEKNIFLHVKKIHIKVFRRKIPV